MRHSNKVVNTNASLDLCDAIIADIEARALPPTLPAHSSPLGTCDAIVAQVERDAALRGPCFVLTTRAAIAEVLS